MLAFLRGEAPRPPRRALAVVELPGRNAVCECVLDLDATALPGSGGKPRVLSWKQVRCAWLDGELPMQPRQGSGCCGLIWPQEGSGAVPGFDRRRAPWYGATSFGAAEQDNRVGPRPAAAEAHPDRPLRPATALPACADGCLPSCPLPQMEGVQAAVTLDDVLESEAALKGNAEFRALMRERYGITDMDLLAVDPWCGCGEVHRLPPCDGRPLFGWRHGVRQRACAAAGRCMVGAACCRGPRPAARARSRTRTARGAASCHGRALSVASALPSAGTLATGTATPRGASCSSCSTTAPARTTTRELGGKRGEMGGEELGGWGRRTGTGRRGVRSGGQRHVCDPARCSRAAPAPLPSCSYAHPLDCIVFYDMHTDR